MLTLVDYPFVKWFLLVVFSSSKNIRPLNVFAAGRSHSGLKIMSVCSDIASNYAWYIVG